MACCLTKIILLYCLWLDHFYEQNAASYLCMGSLQVGSLQEPLVRTMQRVQEQR